MAVLFDLGDASKLLKQRGRPLEPRSRVCSHGAILGTDAAVDLAQAAFQFLGREALCEHVDGLATSGLSGRRPPARRPA